MDSNVIYLFTYLLRMCVVKQNCTKWNIKAVWITTYLFVNSKGLEK